MNDGMDYILWGNTIRDWLVACGIILLACIVLRVFKTLILQRLRKVAARTSNALDDLAIQLISTTVMPLLYLLAVYFGLQYLDLGDRTGKYLGAAMMAVSAFFIIRLINSSLSWFFNRATSRHAGEDRKQQAGGILLLVKGVVWMAGLLFLIDNLGYDITTIVAGLGIGGIAIALAAQTILGDLFSYIVIFFDKPFMIGDFIIVDDKMGTVEYIGIKTTRIRTLGGEQLICSNTDLTNSRVHNYKRMEERRVVFSFGLPQEINPSVLEKIPVKVREIITSLPDVRFDRAHFLGFGKYSLDFEIVYYVLSPDYNLYMDRQQSINLAICRYLEHTGIHLALPRQNVSLEGKERLVQVN